MNEEQRQPLNPKEDDSSLVSLSRACNITAFLSHTILIFMFFYHAVNDFIMNINSGNIIQDTLLFMSISSNIFFLIMIFFTYIIELILVNEKWIYMSNKGRKKLHIWLGYLTAFFAILTCICSIIYINIYDTFFSSQLSVSVIVYSTIVFIILFFTFVMGTRGRKFTIETDIMYLSELTTESKFKNDIILHYELATLLIFLAHGSIIYYLYYMVLEVWFKYDKPETSSDFNRPADVAFKWSYYFPLLLFWIVWKVTRKLFKGRKVYYMRIFLATLLFSIDVVCISTEIMFVI